MSNKREQFKKSLRFLSVVILVILQTVAFAYVWLTHYNQLLVHPFVGKGNWFFCLVYAILYTVFLFVFDGHKYGIYRDLNLISGQILASVSTDFIAYFQIVLLAARFVSVGPAAALVGFHALIAFVFSLFVNLFFRSFFPPKRTVIIYENYSPDTFIEKLNQREDKFEVKEVIHVSEGLDKIKDILSENDCAIIYDIHSELRNKLLKICFVHNIRTYTTTKVSDILVRAAEPIHMFDTPLLLYRNIGLTFEQRFFKRALDIIVSLFLLIVTSPFFLASALAVKLYDGGPVFFTQKRCTINGKVFKIHKFRSMVVDAEKSGAPHPAEKYDKRITPVGRVLRVSRLDELPQLIDILIGNMSLVGPRPERIEHVKQYTEELPEFEYRLKVRGGLTGYAQLYGKYNTTPYDKLQLDLTYIQNYSFFLDIRLILMTIKIMFMKESTEGFTKEKSQSITDKNKKEK